MVARSRVTDATTATVIGTNADTDTGNAPDIFKSRR